MKYHSRQKYLSKQRLAGWLVAGATLLLMNSTVWAAEGFTLEQVAKLRAVGEAEISPDGQYIAYTLSVPRNPFTEDNGSAWRELHVVDLDGNSRPFITGEVNISGLAWTPDGRAISYLAKRNDDKQSSLYTIPLDGGESRRILTHKAGIQSYAWSPDGEQVAFLAVKKRPKEQKKLRDKGFNQEVYEEDQNPVRVWIARPEDTAAKPRQLDLPGSASTLRWSPEGTKLVVALAPTTLVDDRLMARKLHVVDVSAGEVTVKFDNPGKLGRFAISQDGKYLAFTSGVDLNDPSAGHLMVGTIATGEIVDLLPNLDGHVGSLAWRDRKTILYTVGTGVNSTVNEIRYDGTKQKNLVPPGGPILYGLSVSTDGKHLVFDASTPTHSWEVFYLRPGADRVKRLTDNNPWLAEVRLAPQEAIDFTARDGLQLQGILIHPLDEQPGQRYPLVLTVHGGPESHESNSWKTSYSRLGQVLAARGFAVFFPNYRGSTGRGVEFSKMGQNDYAGGEFNDLVDAVNHLVETGLVDRDRVGITGGSYGGYASAWGATALTEHFAASVMSVGISDLISKFGTTDIPNEMYLVHARSWPWEKWQWYLERSPIYHAQKARTPILILHGKNDTRVHPSQSMELYRYLKTLDNVPVRLVFYPGEGHGNRRAAARYDFSLRKLRWMEHYLQGPGGDPPPFELTYPLGEDVDDDDDDDDDDDEE